MIKILRTAAFLLCTAVAAPVMAQDFDKGMEALRAGDYETALQEWRPLAEQGDAFAQSNLGTMYANGLGVILDDAEAANWFRLGAEQGNVGAQLKLGFMYFSGRGVIQDYAEAANWYRQAAEQDYSPAQFNLGNMYLDGDGVIQDYVIAHMWINISAANGYASGSESRGVIEEFMTREQIAEAQALARRCMSSNYQHCG
jgi:TPR repeat protein